MKNDTTYAQGGMKNDTTSWMVPLIRVTVKQKIFAWQGAASSEDMKISSH